MKKIILLAALAAFALCAHAQEEVKKPRTVSGLVAFTQEDKEKEHGISPDWLKALPRAGFKVIGKPKGTVVDDAGWNETMLVVRFTRETAFTDVDFHTYAKGLWDLNTLNAENGELSIRVYQNGKPRYFPVTDIRKTSDAYTEETHHKFHTAYRWFYLHNGGRWECSVYLRGDEKRIIQVTLEKQD